MGIGTGKVALVTGGNRGIGRGIADALALEGYTVAITARDAGVALEAAKAIGHGARGFACDVRKPEQVAAVFAAVEAELGGLDVLVNNAGVGLFSPIATMSIEDWHTVIDTNVNGLFYCTREAIPRMQKRGGGYIFNVSSLAGKNAFPSAGAYCASKHAVNGLSEVLFQEVRDLGIRVTYLMPGSVATDFGRGTAAKQDWALQAEDVGEMVVDLLKTNPRAMHSRVEMRPARPQKG
ncbi:MAG: SDR family oxidoreductase [Candidatus Eisenbacteria bacterium]|jgi:NAD(P)-dependent dehydrogenase (short-subunit alcohol dehydrogenase family)|nr:SDR family oxidoreductase [Candidatus Eisenbacteria bacterium]